LGHPLSDGPLPTGQLFDAGTRSYGEFACSKQTFAWLTAGGMETVNGQPVRLQVMEECVGGHNLLVKAWPIT
jgi:hypothetical protein